MGLRRRAYVGEKWLPRSPSVVLIVAEQRSRQPYQLPCGRPRWCDDCRAQCVACFQYIAHTLDARNMIVNASWLRLGTATVIEAGRRYCGSLLCSGSGESGLWALSAGGAWGRSFATDVRTIGQNWFCSQRADPCGSTGASPRSAGHPGAPSGTSYGGEGFEEARGRRNGWNG